MPTNKLEITNPDQLLYQTKELGITVLGGIKLDGLDRLRVTIKLEAINRQYKHYLNNPEIAALAIRHNLDLYNDTQVEKLVRKAAQKLEIGTSAMTIALSELTNQLEQYRLAELERTATDQKPQAIHLSPSQREEAETFLKSSNLLENTNQLIGKSGVIGEATNRLLMYLIFTSRKLPQPLHIISLGASGTGKTHLQEKVGELIPEEDKLSLTSLSENSFYYFGRQELKNKLILIEDLDGAESSLYPLRELQSKKRISKTVAHKNSRGTTQTIHLVVEGPVSVAGCTTKEQLYEDNANRSFLIYLDESEAQDENIMQYQRNLSAGLINEETQEQIKQLLQNTQRTLQPIKIINPYAPQLKIPPTVFKPRRTNNHYLQFIEAITFYHQYQREVKTENAYGEPVEPYIETTLEDIQAANQLLSETLLRKSDGLTGACRNYFERLKQWLQEEKKTAFTNTQARQYLKESHSSQKHYMVSLQQSGLIRKSSGDKKKGYYYEVVNKEEYEKLQAGIANVLDEIFIKLNQEVNREKEVKHTVEPLLPRNIQENSKKLKSSPEEKSSQKKQDTLQPVNELPEHLETYLNTLKTYLTEQNQETFTTTEISQHFGKSNRTLRNYHKQLTERGYLKAIPQQGNSPHQYQLTSSI